MMRIYVCVFPFYRLYYLQSFICFYIFEPPRFVSFYVLTCVALLNIVIDTSALQINCYYYYYYYYYFSLIDNLS